MAVASIPTLALPSIFLYSMRQDGRDGWFIYVLMTPFLVVGLLLEYFGLRALLRIVVRGSWQLEIPDEGGILGHSLPVRLFPARECRPSAELVCRLRCIRISRGARGSSRGNVVTLWEENWNVSSSMIHPELGLALMLPLPDSGQPTHMDRSGSGVQWQLNVAVPSREGAEEPVFDLPVRR